MEKRQGVIAFALLATLMLASSCATFNKERLATVKQVALVTVMCDKRVQTGGFGGLAGMISQLAQNSSFDLKPVCEEVKNSMFTKYASKFPFVLLPEERVIRSAGYQQLQKEFDQQIGAAIFHAVPEGYASVQYTDDEDLNKIFRNIPEADGTMIVEASFMLTKKSDFLGFGSATVATYMTIVVKNRQNQDALKVNLRGESQHKIDFALGGVFDASQVQPLCLEATQDALYYFDKWVKSNL